jgi:hypothetical protein
MFWVVGVAVAAAVAALGGGLLARSWIVRLGGVVPVRSSGVWWTLGGGVAGRPRAAVVLVPVRSVPGRCDLRCTREVWRS